MKADIYEIDKLDVKSEGSLDLPDNIFAIEPNFNVIKLVINWQLAKRRSGNHKTKTVSEVRGTTAKPFKQKGTGRARQGSLRSVQMRGGGVNAGPVVRSHEYKLNKKVKKLGLKSSLSYLLKEGKLKIIKDPVLEKAETARIAKAIRLDGRSLFLINDTSCEKFLQSVGNVRDVNLLNVKGLNVYDLINSNNVFISESSINLIKEKLS
ncbi:MAG: 50S ribosomal protein L4 [Rickettsiales bacterium]|jgi:large subunit ribosomal protein L4|nr:50S ribosomal protein L4 [Rickettsiales bacterium]